MAEPARVHRVTREGAWEAADPAPEKVLVGPGTARVLNAFSDPSGRFHAGHWQAEPGKLAVDYSETELCVIIGGRVRLEDADGGTAEYGPGDAFVIAAGFRGTWESIGLVTKIYAILEPA